MINNVEVLDLKQIKTVERIFDLIVKEGLINLSPNDIQHFFKDAKSLTVQSVNIKNATKEDVEKSGILSDELKKSQKCIISIIGNANITLSDIDTIVGAISSFHNCEYNFSTLYNETQKGYQIDTFLVRIK